jgi:hypothetical protein
LHHRGGVGRTAARRITDDHKGPHAGEGIALDHVLPRSILPELAAKLFNLEAITAKDNRAKSAKITARELKLARQWN